MTDLLLKSKNKVSFVKFFKAESFPLARYIIQLWHLGKEGDQAAWAPVICVQALTWAATAQMEAQAQGSLLGKRSMVLALKS